MPLLAVVLVVTGCGDDGGPSDGDPAAFCARLDRLTNNDPFRAFGDRATTAEIEQAFTALVARASEIVDVAPPEARGAAGDYADAARELDDLMAGAAYDGNAIDARAYRDQQVAYAAAAARLERHLESEC
jgi:hypothetical protein